MTPRVVVAAALAIAPAASPAEPDAKALYDKMCASCHGADGRGNPEKAETLKVDPAILNLGRAESKDLTRDQLKQILLEGKDKMPKYAKKLKPDQQDPVLDYAIELARAIRGEKK